MQADEAHAFQFQQNLMGAVVDFDILGLNAQFRVLRYVVGVRDAGELFDLAFTRQLVQALAVAAFALFDAGGHVNLAERTELFDILTDRAAGGRVWRDRRADGDATVLGDL